MIGALLRRLRGGCPPETPRPPTSLSEAQALAIAGRRISSSGIAVLAIAREDDGMVWTIGTQNIGVNETVRIADATGLVIDYRRDGLR